MASKPESQSYEYSKQAEQKGKEPPFRVPEEKRYLPSSKQSAESISEQDRLNRDKLISALATTLTGENDHHQTIGLLGDWGVGKSTAVHLLRKALRQRHNKQPYLFAEFNAWEYEHTDNLQAGIAQEMIKGLSSYQLADDQKAVKSVQGWLKRELSPVMWWLGVRLPTMFRFATALNGTQMLSLLVLLLVASISMTWADMKSMAEFTMGADLGIQMFMGGGTLVLSTLFYRQLKTLLANPLAKELLTYMKLPNYGEHLGSIPVMRKNIRALCDVRLNPVFGRKKRMLFVVDDLDRCGQKGIVKVFEAVRLVLDIPQVTVIIAVDQRIALAALALQYQELAEHHQLSNPRAIARDYLAKVIHLPIILTPADTEAVNGFLQAVWAETEDKKEGEVDSELKIADDFEDNGSSLEDKNVSHGLSDPQKKLFQQWAQHFAFSNPRQLKRLHNSYNLLRFYFGENESQVLPQLSLDLSSPFLISLFALEYINSLEDPTPRAALMKRLQQKQSLAFREETTVSNDQLDPQGRITEEVLSVMLRKHEDSGMRYVEAVTPFVLPAIQILVQPDAHEKQIESEKENS